MASVTMTHASHALKRPPASGGRCAHHQHPQGVARPEKPDETHFLVHASHDYKSDQNGSPKHCRLQPRKKEETCGVGGHQVPRKNAGLGLEPHEGDVEEVVQRADERHSRNGHGIAALAAAQKGRCDFFDALPRRRAEAPSVARNCSWVMPEPRYVQRFA